MNKTAFNFAYTVMETLILIIQILVISLWCKIENVPDFDENPCFFDFEF